MALKGSVVLFVLWTAAVAWPQGPQRDGIATLVARLEQVANAADRSAILAMGDGTTNPPGIAEFADMLTTPASRVVVRERDRSPLDVSGMRLVLEVFSEHDIEGRLATWRVDVQQSPAGSNLWRIIAVARLSVVTGLYRLSLNIAKEYDIKDVTVRAPDLALTIASGSAFVAETPEGPTAVVLMGRGRMHFTPTLPAERTQLRIFSGDEAMSADFDTAFIRVRPSDYPSVFEAASLQARPVAPDDLRRATAIFEEYIGKSLQIDLSDLSRDRWSLPPSDGDVIAEVRTRRFGTITYARSSREAEDVSVFDRKRQKNISVYASAEKLVERGPFYSDDDLVEYDVLAYDIDVELTPERQLISGNARIKVKIRSPGTSSLTFRLAQSLAVRGVYSPEFGRLLHLRVVGQNSVIVNLPAIVTRDMELWFNVIYDGRLPAQMVEGEALTLGREIQESHFLTLEPRFLYSNRSYWYPQSPVTDYATAKLRITVPAEYDVIASGDPVGPPAPPPGVAEPGRRARKTFVFDAGRPARYLACLVSRLSTVDSAIVALDPVPTGVSSDPQLGAAGRPPSEISLYVQANPREVSRGREMMKEAASILQYYASLVGGAPYPSFTLVLTEGDRPGGHSPPYFAVLNQVVASSVVWRNDPVSFESYPTFFLAHELAHQWWGHAVGWKNYHEQWISEGFSQYFAALYAEKARPGNVLGNLLRQMRYTAISASSNGPVYLGYRLGHIKGDDRVFRAIVYNKSAMVLHMLRRLLGDRTFFAGVRGFYEEWKFQKAGTDDFRRALEKVSGRDLRRFFDAWIYGTVIPRVKFEFHVQGQEAALRLEQRGDPVDVPITVTITYVNGQSEETIVALAEQVTERTVMLKGDIRSIVANADNGALVEIER